MDKPDKSILLDEDFKESMTAAHEDMKKVFFRSEQHRQQLKPYFNNTPKIQEEAWQVINSCLETIEADAIGLLDFMGELVKCRSNSDIENLVNKLKDINPEIESECEDFSLSGY